jgi:putative ABC transport system permease protein
MRPYALVYFYRRRLRVHGAQEVLAGLGVAVAVALVFAVTVAANSLSGAAASVVHTVAGPANLQLHARGPEGMDEDLLAQVEGLPGVMRAATLLEQTATIIGRDGRRTTVTIAGAGAGLILMDGLARTLPGGVLSAKGIGLSQTSAESLGIAGHNSQAAPVDVTLDLRGSATRLAVTAVLGHEAAGALSLAQVAVMPLRRLQRLAGLPHRVSRILIQTRPGRERAVRSELEALSQGRLEVATADHEVALLRQALRPSNQASGLFAGLAALLGFLFAFNAILLTTPERRAAITDLRLDGTKRSAIIQMVLFQALCLGVAASIVGLIGGYVLAIGVFQASPGYLAQAFTLGGNTVIGARPVILALAGGIIATCAASAVPLQDLRHGRPMDAVYVEARERGRAPQQATSRQLLIVTCLLAIASALFALVPSAAIAACVLLALATMLAVPLVLSAVLRAAEMLARRNEQLTTLPLAVESLRARTLRSLALAATGAVALFGSVALNGAQNDLLRGLHSFARAYSTDGEVWVVNPGYIPETTSFRPDADVTKIARVPGVTTVDVLQSEFMNMSNRRLVILARPAGLGGEVLRTQLVDGNADEALERLRQRGWVVVSKQVAEEQKASIGQALKLPTPTGPATFRVAALTTNFGWPGGAVLMNTADYSHLWATRDPSALVVDFRAGTNVAQARRSVLTALGARNGLEAIDAATWSDRFDGLAGEGLGQLDEISILLVCAAILAMAAALGSSIWQRRGSLAELLLDGAPRRRLLPILLTESLLVLSAGCLTGTLSGIYGQFVIDSYLNHITGFPVSAIATVVRPIETLVLVVAAVLVVVSLPAWLASRVSPALGLTD